jgi:CRP/FNR family transcriptional regulator, cyclic AMP receptor protein
VSVVDVTVFKNMSGEDRSRLELGGIILEPRNGATIFAQGDPADAVFAIIAGDGRVRVGSVDRHSEALMVEVFRAGEIFGEIDVIDGGSRTVAAVTEGRVRLLKIRGTNFLAALSGCPALGDALCRTMSWRMRRTLELFQDATFNTMEVCLARQFLYLSSQEGPQTPRGIRRADRQRQAHLPDLVGATSRGSIAS